MTSVIIFKPIIVEKASIIQSWISFSVSLLSSWGLPWWFRQKRISLQGRRPRFDPWVGKIPWRRAWQPTLYSYLKNPKDRWAWWTLVHGIAKSWMTEWLILSKFSVMWPCAPLKKNYRYIKNKRKREFPLILLYFHLSPLTFLACKTHSSVTKHHNSWSISKR